MKKAVKKLKAMERGWSRFILSDIVQYNIRYRDLLRQSGIESLVNKLVGEAPELKDDKAALNYLREWWQRERHVAAYDIQCYNIGDEITVLGHTFHGLKDVAEHCAIVGKEFRSDIECFTPKKFDEYSDIHIGEIYQSYPQFDSYDCDDNRTYQNYIFRREPITADELKKAFLIPHDSNFRMVHEDIPENLLPVLYYKGDGDYMLLATSKK